VIGSIQGYEVLGMARGFENLSRVVYSDGLVLWRMEDQQRPV